MIRVAALHRYPVKGLSPERRPGLELVAGAHVPGDRIFAIENGPSGFDPDNPLHQPKIRFLMLMRNEALARLSTRYCDETTELTVAAAGQDLVRAPLATPEGRARIAETVAEWLEAQMPGAMRGAARLLVAPAGFRFTDTQDGHISLINLASVAALEEHLGAPVDPLRFRGNVHLQGLAAWAEFALVGQRLGNARGLVLEITGRIDRCAATAVDPATGLRDLPVVRTLQTAYGHIDCGVFARVVSGGRLSEGDHLDILPASSTRDLGLR